MDMIRMTTTHLSFHCHAIIITYAQLNLSCSYFPADPSAGMLCIQGIPNWETLGQWESHNKSARNTGIQLSRFRQKSPASQHQHKQVGKKPQTHCRTANSSPASAQIVEFQKSCFPFSIQPLTDKSRHLWSDKAPHSALRWNSFW